MKELIFKDIITAMKEKNKLILETLRMVKSAIQMEEIKLKRELTEDEIINIISKQIKTRKESIVEFEKGNRQDLVEKTKNEIEILNNYMPKQLDEDEILKIVLESVSEVKATNINDLGKVMGNITPKLKGKADMALVNKIVKEKLQ